MRERARSMRKNPTPAEETLWHRIRKKAGKLITDSAGNTPSRPFIVDFYSVRG